MVRQPVSPYLLGLANAQGDINRTGLTNDIVDNLAVILTNTGSQQRAIKLHARIERIAPGPMGITVKESYQPESPIFLGPNQTLQLNPNIISEAFGRFSTNDLVFENTSLSELRSNAVNYKLPEGQYRICVTAYDYNHPGHSMPLSVIGTGCANFTICYSASAPQFVMPVSSMGSFNQDFEEITPHSSQIQFTWTPSITTCGLPMGALYYDLEIREIFPGQLKTDALNNPPVFERKNIPTTTFLLDTIRFPNVLVKDQRYIVRVKANLMQQANSPLVIDNDGYSEIIGVIYKPEEDQEGGFLIGGTKEGSTEEEVDLFTKKIKGKLSWAFRKSEEDFGSSKKRPIKRFPVGRKKRRMPKDIDQTPVHYYMGNDLLIQNNYTAITQIDPTLNLDAGFVSTIDIPEFPTSGSTYGIAERETTVSSSRASTITFENKEVGRSKGNTTYPLEGATVQLKIYKSKIDMGNMGGGTSTPQDNNRPEYIGGRTKDAWSNIIAEGAGIYIPGNVLPPTMPIPRTRGGLGPVPRGPNPGGSSNANIAMQTTKVQEGKENRWEVIATGVTDAHGNFNLEFLSEEFLENVDGEKWILSVDQPGYYYFSHEIPSSKMPQNVHEADLGEFTLVANIFRFTPSVKDVLLESTGFPMENLTVDIYRPSDLFLTHGFLKYEGNHNVGQARETKTFNGKQYHKVASVSMDGTEESFKSHDFGKLFAFKDFYMEISSERSGLEPFTTNLRVRTTRNLSSEIAHVFATYEPTFKPAAVEGRVVLYSEDHEVPIENAVVNISFNPEDVIHDSSTNRGSYISIPVTPQHDFPIVTVGDFTGVNPYASSLPPVNGTTWPMTTYSHEPSSNMDTSTSQGRRQASFTYTPIQATYLGEDISPVLQDISIIGGLFDDALETTATTDASGYFYIGNLPELKEGANYTLSLVSVPSAYDDLPVDPTSKEMTFSISPGSMPFKEFKLLPEVVPLVGKVVDENGEVIANARLHFENSNSYFETDPSGVFQTTYFPGTHTLIVEKNGYVEKEGTIEIETNQVTINPPLAQEALTVEGPETEEPIQAGNFSTYSGMINQTVSGGDLRSYEIINPFRPFNPSTDFFAGIEEGSFYASVSNVLDMGNIGFLERKRAKVQFVVKDKETDEPIEGVNIRVFDTTHTTNINGEWLYEGFGGNTIVTMTPPEDSKYVAVRYEVEFPANNELVEEVFYLEEGVRAYGKARIAGSSQVLDSVRVRVDDKEYIQIG